MAEEEVEDLQMTTTHRQVVTQTPKPTTKRTERVMAKVSSPLPAPDGRRAHLGPMDEGPAAMKTKPAGQTRATIGANSRRDIEHPGGQARDHSVYQLDWIATAPFALESDVE